MGDEQGQQVMFYLLVNIPVGMGVTADLELLSPAIPALPGLSECEDPSPWVLKG